MLVNDLPNSNLRVWCHLSPLLLHVWPPLPASSGRADRGRLGHSPCCSSSSGSRAWSFQWATHVADASSHQSFHCSPVEHSNLGTSSGSSADAQPDFAAAPYHRGRTARPHLHSHQWEASFQLLASLSYLDLLFCFSKSTKCLSLC